MKTVFSARGSGRVMVMLGVLFAVGLALSGCATWGLQDRVNVSVTNLRPATATILETGLQLTLRVTNEGSEPLVISGSSHKLFLNGTAIGRAVSNEPFTVSGLDTSTVTVTVYMENLKLLRKFRNYQEIRAVEYRLESRLHSTSHRTIGTVAEGSLDIREFTSALPLLSDQLN